MRHSRREPLTFASLLAPMTVAEFRERSWNTKALYLGGRKDRFARLAFDVGEFQRGLNDKPLAEVIRAQSLGPHGEHREMRIQPTQIEACFGAGMTICVNNVDTFLPSLAAQSQELRRSINFPGLMSFSQYWSPPDGGFGVHYDQHAVFIFQIEGKKRWTYSEIPALVEPRENFVHSPEGMAAMAARGMDIPEPTDDKLLSVVLEPGDILYLPAGCWHKTTAVGGASRSLTFRGFDGTVAETAYHALKAWMDLGGAWRRPLPPVDRRETPGDELPPVIESIFAERLAELKVFVNGLQVTDLARAWAELQSFAEPRAAAVAISPQSRFAVRNGVRVLRSQNEVGTCLYVYDGASESELLLAENAFVVEVIRAGEFLGSDACRFGAPSTWDETRPLLEQLMAQGIIDVVVQ